MIEWYDLAAFGKPRTPEQNLDYLQNAIALAKSGRLVWLKAWPYPHSFLDRAFNANPMPRSGRTQRSLCCSMSHPTLVAEVPWLHVPALSMGLQRGRRGVCPGEPLTDRARPVASRPILVSCLVNQCLCAVGRCADHRLHAHRPPLSARDRDGRSTGAAHGLDTNATVDARPSTGHQPVAASATLPAEAALPGTASGSASFASTIATIYATQTNLNSNQNPLNPFGLLTLGMY